VIIINLCISHTCPVEVRAADDWPLHTTLRTWVPVSASITFGLYTRLVSPWPSLPKSIIHSSQYLQQPQITLLTSLTQWSSHFCCQQCSMSIDTYILTALCMRTICLIRKIIYSCIHKQLKCIMTRSWSMPPTVQKYRTENVITPWLNHSAAQNNILAIQILLAKRQSWETAQKREDATSCDKCSS